MAKGPVPDCTCVHTLAWRVSQHFLLQRALCQPTVLSLLACCLLMQAIRRAQREAEAAAAAEQAAAHLAAGAAAEGESSGSEYTTDVESEQEEEEEGEEGVSGDEEEEQGEQRPESAVSSVTADFAMQNVLLQMGLRLVAPDGRRVSSLSRWVLRCTACYGVTKVRPAPAACLDWA